MSLIDASECVDNRDAALARRIKPMRNIGIGHPRDQHGNPAGTAFYQFDRLLGTTEEIYPSVEAFLYEQGYGLPL